jgi:hypothetical protein
LWASGRAISNRQLSGSRSDSRGLESHADRALRSGCKTGAARVGLTEGTCCRDACDSEYRCSKITEGDRFCRA